MPKVSLTELIAGAIAGKTVSFPTDTVPALAARPPWARAIFTAKQRPPDKPLILMAASAPDLWPYARGTPETLAIWQEAARRYWPGQVTLVLPSSSRVPPAMHPTDPTSIGLRVPDCPVALEILRQTGPLATTSANLSGEPPLRDLDAIAAAFPQVLTLDGRELEVTETATSGLPSTVAKWTGEGWEILRQGKVKLNQ